VAGLRLHALHHRATQALVQGPRAEELLAERRIGAAQQEQREVPAVGREEEGLRAPGRKNARYLPGGAGKRA